MITVGGIRVTDGQLQTVAATPPSVARVSGGLALAGGSSGTAVTEIITNAVDRDFSAAGNWTLDAGITVPGTGVMTFTAAPDLSDATLTASFTNPDIAVGSTYLTTFTVSGYTGGYVSIYLGGNSVGTPRSANGTYREIIFIIPGSGTNVRMVDSGVTTLDVDNVSVKLIPSGTLFISNLGASAVPGTAVRVGGIAVSPEGMVYVTTDAPASASFIGGMAVRADGALHVSTDAVAGTDSYVGGIAVTPTGQVRVAIT